jgi:hypothetical protein
MDGGGTTCAGAGDDMVLLGTSVAPTLASAIRGDKSHLSESRCAHWIGEVVDSLSRLDVLLNGVLESRGPRSAAGGSRTVGGPVLLRPSAPSMMPLDVAARRCGGAVCGDRACPVATELACLLGGAVCGDRIGTCGAVEFDAVLGVTMRGGRSRETSGAAVDVCVDIMSM